VFLVLFSVVDASLVASDSAIDCVERLVSKVTCYVWSCIYM